MSEALQRINQALEALTEAGCRRRDGCWFDKTGNPLDSDPVESWRLLRHVTIKRVVEQKRSAGELFHR